MILGGVNKVSAQYDGPMEEREEVEQNSRFLWGRAGMDGYILIIFKEPFDAIYCFPYDNLFSHV